MEQVRNFFSNLKTGRGRPKSNFRKIETSSQEGCREGETRYSFVCKEAVLEKVQALAYWERLKVREVIEAAIDAHLERYEQANGPIKPKPKGRAALSLGARHDDPEPVAPKQPKTRWRNVVGNLVPGEFVDFPCESHNIKRTAGARDYGKVRGWRMFIFPLDEKTVRIVRVK